MKRLLLALVAVTSIATATEPTPEELLKPRRIEGHEELFQKIDILISHRGLTPAKASDLEDPTIHYTEDSLHEWAYYIQPIVSGISNVVMIGFDKNGEPRLYRTNAMLFFGESDIVSKKSTELEKHVRDIESLIQIDTGHTFDSNRSIRLNTCYIGAHEIGIAQADDIDALIKMNSSIDVSKLVDTNIE